MLANFLRRDEIFTHTTLISASEFEPLYFFPTKSVDNTWLVIHHKVFHQLTPYCSTTFAIDSIVNLSRLSSMFPFMTDATKTAWRRSNGISHALIIQALRTAFYNNHPLLLQAPATLSSSWLGRQYQHWCCISACTQFTDHFDSWFSASSHPARLNHTVLV